MYKWSEVKMYNGGSQNVQGLFTKGEGDYRFMNARPMAA